MESSLELRRQIEDSIAARGSSDRGGAPRGSSRGGAAAASDRDGRADPGVPPPGSAFEYLDHPADVILHSWGSDFSGALASLAEAMFGYMTSLESVVANERQGAEHETNVAARGHNLHSLVYSFLDGWLFNFHDTGFVPRDVTVSELRRDVWSAVSSGRGEVLDIRRHPQGTEVKAVTYSGMRVEEGEGRCDVYVVVDI